jgi:acyl-CoA synthetase (AMP-forming)/AMP-acid ligase II
VPLGVPPAPLHTAVPFAAELARHGDAPALVLADGTHVSYAELAARVADVAAQLGSERRLVLVAGGNALEPVVSYLAALSAGHPVLLVPGDQPAALAALADAYDPDVVLGPDAAGAWRLQERREGTAHELHPDLALLLSTSGSTGSPKLVRLSHDNVQSNAEAIAAYLRIRDSDRAVTTLPLHYCYGLSVLNSHLACGAAVVLTDLSVVDGCFWELVRRERATSLAGVPYTFELLDRVGFAEMDLPHLRYVTQAGGRLAPERVARWAAAGRARGWDLFVMYGQTEATARMAYLPPDLAAAHPGTIGVPIPGGSFALEPAGDDPAAGGDVGELLYAGPNVMLGYATEPGDLALGRTVDVLRTGDLARRTAEGLYEIVGRRSRFAKLLGLRIDLDRAEAVLSACCLGRDEELVVAVDDDRDAGLLRRRAAAELGVPAGAVRVLAVPELPRLASGKVDYVALEALAGREAPGVAVPGAEAADAAGLRALFAAVLDVDVDAVRDDSTFVELGGDSLSYVQASVRLEAALGRLPIGWHVTPIAELARSGAAAATDGRRWTFGHALETSVLLRALAIVCIVGTHAGLFGILGGAHLLVAVAGFNFARFQLGPAARRERLRRQVRSIARIAVPSVAWIALMALATDQYGLANVVLANALVGPEPWTTEWRFWFVEVLLYMLVAFAAVLAIPWADRCERATPLAFALALFAVGLLGRYGLLDLGAPHTRPALWLFALGWAAARCTAPWQRACLTALALATVPGFFGDVQREAFVAGGIVLLLWAPSVRCPAVAGRVLAVLASASLYVYLVHWQVYPLLRELPLLGVAASIAAGIVYWQVVAWGWRTAGARASAAMRRAAVRLPRLSSPREPVEAVAR